MARAGGRPHGALHPDTFNELQCDEAAQIAQLRTVDQQLGLTLQPAQLVLPGATLKRAQVSRYDGTPIAQITYLDPAPGPLALRITFSEHRPRATAAPPKPGLSPERIL